MNPITDVIGYVATSYVAWFFAALTTLATFLYRKLNLLVKGTAERNNAISEGVQAMLRNDIIDKYNHYKEKGHCPIYAKENVKRLYKPYSDLGGNGVLGKLVEELLEMPTEKQKKKEGDEK